MYPHRIRLRGPWECEPLESADGLVPPASRVTMPCHWGESGLSGFAGRVRYRRRFGYPGRLDDTERVWLTFSGATERADVSLNGVVLGSSERAGEPFEFEATALLRERNELVVEVTGAGPAAGLWGEVALEIRRTAFLRGVRFAAEVGADAVHLRARGEVVGSADGPLELYLLLDRSTVAYKTVTASAAGAPFAITSEPVALAQWQSLAAAPLTLDLVQGATIWYRRAEELTTDHGPRTTD
jgi:hypothetical protein